MADYQTIIVEKEDAVASVLLDRPKSLNAFNKKMRAELLAALTELANDDKVRVVVLGSTSSVFSSGADLAEGVPKDKTIEQQITDEYVPSLLTIAEMEKPVIAAVPGVMAGIGSSFAMQCDLAVMADNASLVLAFSNVGLVPDGGASWLLMQKLGYARAYELIAEGGRLSAEQCLAAGIVNKVVAADQVNRVAKEWAKLLSERAPVALREAKKILRSAASLSFIETAQLEAASQNLCVSTEDSKEAVTAFFEKRQPVFTGR